jgi:hypothetical protein
MDLKQRLSQPDALGLSHPLLPCRHRT